MPYEVLRLTETSGSYLAVKEMVAITMPAGSMAWDQVESSHRHKDDCRIMSST